MKNKYKISRLDTIGTADAEADHSLIECFQDIGYINVLRDVDDHRNIILGRTGSGKSALLKMLRESEERVIEINPEDLSLAYVANSTIINYLENLNVRFDLFYKMLWRHVLGVEIIRTFFHLRSKESSDRWLFSFKETNKKKKNKEAVEYLEKWGSKFWEETDFRVKEITDNFSTQLESGINLPNISFEGKADIKEEKRYEILQRAQSIVNKIQMQDLSKIIDLIDDILDDQQKKFYITIDKLDENWIEDSMRYSMIKSLIETAKDYKKVKNLKIVIALREDLLNRVIDKTRDSGFQKEKYESLFLYLQWSRDDLEKMLDKRVTSLIKRKGNVNDTKFVDLLPNKINRTEDPLNYILDRTLMRPRDAINYANILIRRSDGRNVFTAQIIREAESEYSSSRFSAISDEWFSDYPNFSKAAQMLSDRKYLFNISKITKDDCDDFCLEVLDCDSSLYKIGKIFKLAEKYIESEISYEDYRNEYIRIFFEMGIIGLKMHTKESVVYFLDEYGAVKNPVINETTRVYVHKAFWRELRIQE